LGGAYSKARCKMKAIAGTVRGPPTSGSCPLPGLLTSRRISSATVSARARLCKFCHPFYQSLWHFLPVQVFSGEMTPAILQSCSTTMGLGLLRATERVSREVTTALGKQAARAIVGRAGLRRIAMCTWRWLGPAAKLIAAIGPAMIGTSQPKRLLVL